MKNLSAIIIDDEKHAREVLSLLVQMYCPHVQIIGEADNVDNAISKLKTSQPDLVFLDIAIGNRTGFELLEHFQRLDAQIIFTTGHSEFAVKAFRVNALDYLLKPIIPDELVAAVYKAQDNIDKNKKLNTQIQHLSKSISKQSLEKIGIPTQDGITFLDIPEVTHLQGSGNYTTFHLTSGDKCIASKGLKYYEKLLPLPDFYRCHQSYLVHLKYITKISTSEGTQIVLKNGVLIPVARKRKDGLVVLMRR